MECRNEHYRHLLLFYFRKGKKAAEAHKKLCEVYGSDALTERTCQNWFAKFRSGDFSLKDEQRSGRPTEVDDDRLKALIEANQRITVQEIAENVNLSVGAVHSRIKKLSVNKNSVNASNKKTTTVSSKVQSKAGIDADAKQIRKVRSTRSQRSTRKNVTESEKKDGPKESKGSRAETIVQNASKAQSEAVGKKIVKTSDRKDKLSPVVKRSTRRK